MYSFLIIYILICRVVFLLMSNTVLSVILHYLFVSIVSPHADCMVVLDIHVLQCRLCCIIPINCSLFYLSAIQLCHHNRCLVSSVLYVVVCLVLLYHGRSFWSLLCLSMIYYIHYVVLCVYIIIWSSYKFPSFCVTCCTLVA